MRSQMASIFIALLSPNTLICVSVYAIYRAISDDESVRQGRDAEFWRKEAVKSEREILFWMLVRQYDRRLSLKHFRAASHPWEFVAADPAGAVDGWMRMVYHRIPILAPDLRKIGFGCAQDAGEGWTCVLDVQSGR